MGGCDASFCRYESQTFCIDSGKIEQAITEKTQAILATHVYGYPCDVEKIEFLAQKYKLKVIYDGAHAFGCQYKRKSLLSYGDISTCSFHATKLFHTVEGGCIITNDDEIARKLQLYRQFGHEYDDYFSIGINGKNSEFHAAMGLCVLPELPAIIKARKEASLNYDSALSSVDICRPNISDEQFEYNYSYYPVIFKDEETLIKVKNNLLNKGVNSRRYFYPSLNQLPYLKGEPCIVC